MLFLNGDIAYYNYQLIKKRHEILHQFVVSTNSVQLAAQCAL